MLPHYSGRLVPKSPGVQEPRQLKFVPKACGSLGRNRGEREGERARTVSRIIFTWRTPSGGLLAVFFNGKRRETRLQRRFGGGGGGNFVFSRSARACPAGRAFGVQTRLPWPWVTWGPLQESAAQSPFPAFTPAKRKVPRPNCFTSGS